MSEGLQETLTEVQMKKRKMKKRVKRINSLIIRYAYVEALKKVKLI